MSQEGHASDMSYAARAADPHGQASGGSPRPHARLCNKSDMIQHVYTCVHECAHIYLCLHYVWMQHEYVYVFVYESIYLYVNVHVCVHVCVYKAYLYV